MCWPNGEDNISSGPRIEVSAGIYGVGPALNVGYPNGSDGVAPLCHAGTFSRVCSDCRLSLLNSILTQRGMPLTDRLERHGGLFLDSAYTLFFGSRELPEDNSSFVVASLSASRIGSLPLFFLTEDVGWLLPHAFSIRSPSK